MERPYGELTKKGCASDLQSMLFQQVPGEASCELRAEPQAKRTVMRCPQWDISDEQFWQGLAPCLWPKRKSRLQVVKVYPMNPGIAASVARLPSSNTLLAIPKPLH